MQVWGFAKLEHLDWDFMQFITATILSRNCIQGFNAQNLANTVGSLSASLCGNYVTINITRYTLRALQTPPQSAARPAHKRFLGLWMIDCRDAGLGHGHAGLRSGRRLHGICGSGCHQGHPRPQPSEPQVSLLGTEHPA